MTPAQKTRKRSHPIRDIFFGNIMAKIMALVAALALWYYAYSASMYKEQLILPVTVETGEGWRWSILGKTDKTIKVTLSYPQRIRERVGRERDRLRIVLRESPDPSGGDEQQRSIKLSRDHFVAPDDFQMVVEEFLPQEITLKLLREETKRLSVEVQLSDPPPGYVRDDTATYARPSAVEVRGPKSVLADATIIRTELIDPAEVIPFEGTEVADQLNAWALEPYILDAEGNRHDVVCDETVTVALRFTQKPEKIDIPDVPIHLMTPPDYQHIAAFAPQSIRKTTVSILGPPDVVARLTADNIQLYVDVSALEPKEDADTPYPQKIYWNIVELPGAKDLNISLAERTCSVLVTKKPEE